MDMTSPRNDEPVLDQERIIVDPHHHLWPGAPDSAYLLEDLRADTGSGHRVVETVFIECLTGYRSEGPESLRPVGETEFVREIAQASDDGHGARIAGIIGAADLRLGAAVEEVLQ